MSGQAVCPDCGNGWTFDFQQRRVYCRTCDERKADPARLTPHDEGKASGSATDTSSSSAPQPPQERTGWQPIETAPRDYRVRILVYDAAWCGGNPRITATNWVGYRTSDGKTVEKKGSFSGVTRPTHWMPLPDPPPDLIPRDERTTDGSSSSSQESGQTQDVGRK